MDARAAEQPRIRCGPFHEAEGADPVGSAGHYDAFLVVEVPLPWGRDISMSEPFATLAGGEVTAALVGADGRRWRPVGVVPPGPVGAEGVRVTAHERPAPVGGGSASAPGSHHAGPYRRREWTVPPAELVGLCRSLLDGTSLPTAARAEEVDEDVVDLLVCTHGRRDVCCGGAGSELFVEMDERAAGRSGIRVRRCSHTGGHRFAPTAITFPDGVGWAHLDAATAWAVARRGEGDVVPVAACRGAASVPGGAWQAVDREGLARWGWRWAAAERLLVAVTPAADEGLSDAITVEATASLPDDGPVGLRAVAGVGRHVPMPECGARDLGDCPIEPEWHVQEVEVRGPAQ